jgi:hypothetical protein
MEACGWREGCVASPGSARLLTLFPPGSIAGDTDRWARGGKRSSAHTRSLNDAVSFIDRPG